MSKFSKISKQLLSASSALQAVALISTGMVMATVVATPAMAQDFTNVTATGQIVDSDGKGISGASVTVTSNAQGFKQTVEADGNGSYRVTALPQGVYTFEISADGFDSFSDNDVNLTQSSSGNTFRLVKVGQAS
jgi:hypothetical protein